MNMIRSKNEHPQTTETGDDPLSRESIHTLQILDEVSTGKPMTQRDLSRKLGIALGMTNNYLKRLAKSGYIEINKGERKRLHYLLTPKGIAEKSALTYRYIKRSYQFFTETREKIGQSLRYLENEGVRSIVLYKANVLTEMAVLVLLDTSLALIAIVDDDRAGQQFLGQKIQPVKSIKDMVFDRILITTEESVKKVAASLSDLWITEEKICSLQSMEDDPKNKHGTKDETPARRDIIGLLKELKEALHKIYGKNLMGLYLYGSYATQEEDSESDVDVAIVLKDFSDYWEEVQRTGHLISELSLKYNVSISPIRLREADWARGESPFLQNVRKEHVPV